MKLTLLPLQNDEVVRIRCDGPITLRDVVNGDPLEGLLGPHCPTLRVLLNLERAQSIDTSGVNWLMRELKKFGQSSGKLVLYGVPPIVNQMLDFLHLTPLLPIAPNEAAARDMALAGGESGGQRRGHTEERPFDNALPGRMSG